jgi:outer membrane protein
MILRRIQLAFCLLPFTAFAQPASSTGDKWDLRESVEYALQHNISVRQADVQARIVALTYKQSRLGQFPSLDMQNSGGYQFGRSIDPATNEFTTQEILFTNHSVNLNLDVFNWFSKRNTVASNRYQAESYFAGAAKARNDVALNVANAYLQILLSAEQINVSEVQVKQSIEQLSNIEKQVKAGALPELNLAEMEAQLANDSSLLITSKSNYTLSVLQLKAVLNIPADQAFEVEVPTVDKIPIESLADLEPAKVYALATANLPQQKINDFNVLSAIKNAVAAKGMMYPSLVLFGQLDTRYSNAIVNPFTKNTYFRQLNNNFGQAVGLGLRIPIFNGNSARINWQKAKLDVVNAELQKEQGEMTLKQDIWQAYANAVASLEKFNASRKAAETAQKAYDFSRKRFDVGLLNSIDLITNQNNLFRARINMVSAQYDYVFKMKLLEFYKGQGLKL